MNPIVITSSSVYPGHPILFSIQSPSITPFMYISWYLNGNPVGNESTYVLTSPVSGDNVYATIVECDWIAPSNIAEPVETVTTITNFETVSSNISSITGYAAYNNSVVTLSGSIIISNTIGNGQMLFKMKLPSLSILTPLAYFVTVQTGSLNNARTGSVKLVKNGDYVEARALTDVFDTSGQYLGFSATWLR